MLSLYNSITTHLLTYKYYNMFILSVEIKVIDAAIIIYYS